MTSSAHPADAARPRIAVFAKAPAAGTVKTRLIPLLGPEGAARLHASLVRHALAAAIEARPSELQLWCAPDAAHPFFAECAARFWCGLQAQAGGDLGARMANAFRAGTPLILIGSDCPALDGAYVERAWAALRANDAVIGPAEDGGYVLVGLARPVAALFERMPWGDASLMSRTRERVAKLGLRCAELETLWDVDRPEDYHRMRQAGIGAEAPA